MNVLCGKILNFAIFLLFSYFISAVVGALDEPTKKSLDEPDVGTSDKQDVGTSYDPDIGTSGKQDVGTSYKPHDGSSDEPHDGSSDVPDVETSDEDELPFVSPPQRYCYYRILDVFKVGAGNEDNKKSYVSYAILYLRFPNTADVNEYLYIKSPTPEEQESVGNLLFNAMHFDDPPVTAEDLANKYYRFVSKNVVKDLPERLSPINYCNKSEACNYALWYYGFDENLEYDLAFSNIDFDYIITHAFSNIVLHDVYNDAPFRDIGVKRPTHKYFASEYLHQIAENINIIDDAMQTPFEYCKDPV